MRLDEIDGIEVIKATRLIRCVYFLSFCGEIVYVGKTVDLYSRLSSHHEDGKVFDEVGIIEMPDASNAELLRVEKEWIKTAIPMLNVVDTPRHSVVIKEGKQAQKPIQDRQRFLQQQKIINAHMQPSELWELKKFGLSDAIIARLIAYGIKSIEEMADDDFDSVLKIPNIGIVSLLKVRDACEKYFCRSMRAEEVNCTN